MAKAADFDGKANETEVVTSESVKGKRKTSILDTKARLWLITINNPQNHGISLEQSGILERFKEDIKTGRVTYVASVMEPVSYTHLDVYKRQLSQQPARRNCSTGEDAGYPRQDGKTPWSFTVA